MNPLETYLKELSQIRSSGAAVKETSYYGSLASLFHANNLFGKYASVNHPNAYQIPGQPSRFIK